MRRRNIVIASTFVALIAALAAGQSKLQAAMAARLVDAPRFEVDPLWPKPLPNKWSMQQVVGIWVDQMDHVWFLNRGVAAIPIELVAEGDPSAPCCVRGPELIELDQQGTVVNAWGGPGYHPLWPTALQTVIVDRQGFVWVAGTAAQTSFSAVIIGLPVLAPALRDAHSLSLVQVGVVLDSLWIGTLLTLLPWGVLADRLALGV